MIIKKVMLKTYDEIKKMVRKKEVQMMNIGDSGELMHYGTIGNPSAVMSIWFDDYGTEYLVVDHPNLISKADFEARKIFFKEVGSES